MELKDFILKTKALLLTEDNYTPVLDWVHFACDMAESMESSIEDELEDIYLPLAYVKNNFSPGVLWDSLHTLMLGTEIINGAMYLEAGYSRKQVARLAQDGKLECGYLPSTDAETGTLTLVLIAGQKGGYFLAENESPERIARAVRRAARAAIPDDRKIAEVLCDRRASSLRIEAVEDMKTQTVLLDNFNRNTSIGAMVSYWPEDDALHTRDCPVIAQAKMMEDEDEAAAEYGGERDADETPEGSLHPSM